jgi:hypothetical protein
MTLKAAFTFDEAKVRKGKTKLSGHVITLEGFVFHTARRTNADLRLSFCTYQIHRVYKEGTQERVPFSDVRLCVLGQVKAKSMALHKARFAKEVVV